MGTSRGLLIYFHVKMTYIDCVHCGFQLCWAEGEGPHIVFEDSKTGLRLGLMQAQHHGGVNRVELQL